jgi:ubiquinone/menaquinone biosynthesis C-methylase UbiE
MHLEKSMNPDSRPHDPAVEAQHAVFEQVFSDQQRWGFHDTSDPLTRYVRDRRMRIALRHLQQSGFPPPSEMSALVVCGGVGGEATYLRKAGFGKVVNSDFSEQATARSLERDPQIEAIVLNAQEMNLPDDLFDIVLVQDGLHHLPRPVSGLNEMLRVARRAAIVIEPHTGLVANMIGQRWETHDQTINFVFRWNRWIFEQVVLNQLLKNFRAVQPIRVWDHSGAVSKVSRKLGFKILDAQIAKLVYALLTPVNFLGNSFIGIAIKK